MNNKEKRIIKIEPIKKSQERIYFEDGSKVLRCYSPSNPHYFEDETGKLHPIEIYHLEEKTTKVGKSYLRSKNIVSVGFRKDSNPNKYLGLRPDINQKSGEEQLEFSIEGIELDGKKIAADLNKNKVVNPAVVDLGNVMVISNRQFTKQAVKVSSNIFSFKIVYRMHLKGLKINYREDLDEYWIYNLKDKFKFRIVKPSILDAETYKPIFSEIGENFLRGLVKHSLIKQKNGTYLYIKEPTKEFVEAKLLAPYLIDADIYYSDTNDGYVSNESVVSWADCRNAAVGVSAWSGTTYSVSAQRTWENQYLLHRGFLCFDTSGVTNPVAVDFKYYCQNVYLSGYLVAMKGTQATTLTTADYNNFTGSSYGDASYSVGWKNITFNAQGVSDINTSGDTKICHREKGHDYDDAIPGNDTRYEAWIRAYDYTGTTYDPRLEIREVYMKINISDVWKNVEEVKINIGDSWKTVTEMKINIGDIWKDIF